MPRVKRSVPARRRHKKILGLAKGFRMTHRTLFRPANEAVLHALEDAYRDRRARKRGMRNLWIARINAASRSWRFATRRPSANWSPSPVAARRRELAPIQVNAPSARLN